MKRSLEKRLGWVTKSLARERAKKGSLEEEENDWLQKEVCEGFFSAWGRDREGNAYLEWVFGEDFKKPKRRNKKARKKKKYGTVRNDLFPAKNSLGTLVSDAYGKVQTTYTVHFEEDSLQHARVEGQPALLWGPRTNSNHTVKRSHSWLYLGEDDHHAATGQWYMPEFEEGAAATFSALIINTHQVVFFS